MTAGCSKRALTLIIVRKFAAFFSPPERRAARAFFLDPASGSFPRSINNFLTACRPPEGKAASTVLTQTPRTTPAYSAPRPHPARGLRPLLLHRDHHSQKVLLALPALAQNHRLACALGFAGAAAAVSIFLIVFAVMYSKLPPIDSLTDYRPKVPLRVYSAEGTLIGEFGEERRAFVHLNEIPSFVKYAILAAEDNGFYEHSGIEFAGIARAAIANLLTGRRGQGGSTITMQVARNFFLSSERTYTRKLYEIAMAYKIERHLTKDQILEVYLNQIYLGQRSYGFAAAARTYFGKSMNELTIGEAATIAGLPVAPSTYNPIVNPQRATMRKNYVLRRMQELGFIDEQTYQTELNAPLVTGKQEIALTGDTANPTKTVHASTQPKWPDA